jgi:hypothetical protein
MTCQKKGCNAPNQEGRKLCKKHADEWIEFCSQTLSWTGKWKDFISGKLDRERKEKVLFT